MVYVPPHPTVGLVLISIVAPFICMIMIKSPGANAVVKTLLVNDEFVTDIVVAFTTAFAVTEVYALT
jgi:hypothetical protein